jgi:hypothetical protein
MDSQVFIDAARYAHIIAVAIGFGAAFLADYHVVSRLGRPIDDNLTTTLHLCHSVIWAMVAGMWITGLVLIYIRTGFDVANFTPKLICKIITVAILTGNAMLISRIAVPLVEENRGRSLMWLPLRSKLCLAGIGAISSASWMLALAMGSSKVLAASDWIVFAFLMPVIYFLGVFAAVAVMFLLHLGGEMVTHRPAHRAVTGPESVRRVPVSVPADQNAVTRIPADRRDPADTQTDQGPIATSLRERNQALRIAAERKLAAAVQTDYPRAATIPAE